MSIEFVHIQVSRYKAGDPIGSYAMHKGAKNRICEPKPACEQITGVYYALEDCLLLQFESMAVDDTPLSVSLQYEGVKETFESWLEDIARYANENYPRENSFGFITVWESGCYSVGEDGHDCEWDLLGVLDTDNLPIIEVG